MPEIDTQLRTYFDQTVERITDEDVRIRATTERGVPVLSPRLRPRPLAAGAIGFGLAMTLIGVVLVVDRVFGAGMADVGGGGGGGTVGTAPTSGQGSLWLFLPVVFGFGLLATGIISARRRSSDMRERGEGTMQTIETVETPIDQQIMTLKNRDRRLAWLAGILAVAVVGLGIWLIAEVTSSDGATLPAGVESAVDAYNTAWENSDGAAFRSATTPDYTFLSNGTEFSRDYQAGGIDGSPYFEVKILDRTVSGNGPYYVGESEQIRFGSPDAPRYAGHSTFTVTQIDGVWKVSQHTWVGATG